MVIMPKSVHKCVLLLTSISLHAHVGGGVSLAVVLGVVVAVVVGVVVGAVVPVVIILRK